MVQFLAVADAAYPNEMTNKRRVKLRVVNSESQGTGVLDAPPTIKLSGDSTVAPGREIGGQ